MVTIKDIAEIRYQLDKFSILQLCYHLHSKAVLHFLMYLRDRIQLLQQ